MCRLTEMEHLRPYCTYWYLAGNSSWVLWRYVRVVVNLKFIVDRFRQRSRSVSDIWALLTLHGLAWVFHLCMALFISMN